MRFPRSPFFLRTAALAATCALVPAAFAALADAPPPLVEAARAHGEKSVFRVYCKSSDNGRYVATMKVDLVAGTINDSPYRVEGNTLRWASRNAPAPGAAAPVPDRSMEIEGFRYTGPILGGQKGTFECQPGKERPAGVIFSP